jgi:hypothetical protein
VHDAYHAGQIGLLRKLLANEEREGRKGR